MNEVLYLAGSAGYPGDAAPERTETPDSWRQDAVSPGVHGVAIPPASEGESRAGRAPEGGTRSRARARTADNGRVRRALRRTGRWIWSPRRLMLLLGALLILTFPAPNLEFLAWFGLVPGLVLIVRSPTAREGGMRAWWLGAGYLIAALYWMTPEIGPAVLLVGAVVGALWIPFGVAAWKLLRPPVTWPRALAALVVVPSCWLLGEWLRSWQALGGPWAVFGVSQWQHPAVLALAAVGGVWLISFALVHGQRGDRARPGIPAPRDARREAERGPRRARRGRRGGRRRRRAAGVRAHPGQPGGPRGDDRHGAAGNREQRGPAGRRERAADRRAEPLRQAERGQARPDRVGREQHRGGPHPAGEPRPARQDGVPGQARRRRPAGQPGHHGPGQGPGEGGRSWSAPTASAASTSRPGWCRSASTYRSGSSSAG